jgi:uncharacterized repeat protein (TIGR04138 family)
MTEEVVSLQRMLTRDPRYPLDAYVFVREALAFAADQLNLGDSCYDAPPLELDDLVVDSDAPAERHLTGQQLCEAIRQLAVDRFGYMARLVLKNWGIASTSDFGEIVYNMIDAGMMKKSPHDCRSHFDNVYEFDEVFERQYQMKL